MFSSNSKKKQLLHTDGTRSPLEVDHLYTQQQSRACGVKLATLMHYPALCNDCIQHPWVLLHLNAISYTSLLQQLLHLFDSFLLFHIT